MTITVTAQVEFVVGVDSCDTDEFDIVADMGDFGNTHCPTGGYDYSTGEYCLASADDITIPALPATACGNHGNEINAAYGLGVKGARFQILNGVVNKNNVSPPQVIVP